MAIAEPRAPVLSGEEIYERICRVEEQHDLLQYTVDDWRVWPLFRFSVEQALARRGAPVASATPARRTSAVRRREGRARAALMLSDLPRLVAPVRTRYVAKTFTSGLRELAGGRYKDIWFDDLIDVLGDGAKIEHVDNPAFADRRRTALRPAWATSTLLDAVAGHLARLGGPAEVAEIARRLSACFIGEFGLEERTPAWVARSLRQFHWSRRLHAWLFRRMRPTHLLVADPGEYGAVAAAREQGIRVAELQHGIMHRYHGAYAWSSYARPHKARMPLPDILLLYGEHWREELAAGGFWGEELRVVGSPAVDGWRERAARAPRQERCTILVTTQGIDVSGLADFLAAFLRELPADTPCSLVLKLHPAFDRDKTPYLQAFGGDGRAQVLLGHEGPPTFELLTQAHLHVSISSALHYEALGLGVPTVVLPLRGHEVVADLYDAGHAHFVREPGDLARLAERWRSLAVPSRVQDHYFTRGALENMRRELA